MVQLFNNINNNQSITPLHHYHINSLNSSHLNSFTSISSKTFPSRSAFSINMFCSIFPEFISCSISCFSLFKFSKSFSSCSNSRFSLNPNFFFSFSSLGFSIFTDFSSFFFCLSCGQYRTGQHTPLCLR